MAARRSASSGLRKGSLISYYQVKKIINIYVDGTNNPKIPTHELFPLKAFFPKSSSNSIINPTPI